MIDEFVDIGFKRFVALRATLRREWALPTPASRRLHQRCELVEAIRRKGDFDVSVSAYPEKHPREPGFRHRHRHAQCARSTMAATRAITQYFIDNRYHTSGNVERPGVPDLHSDPARHPARA